MSQQRERGPTVGVLCEANVSRHFIEIFDGRIVFSSAHGLKKYEATIADAAAGKVLRRVSLAANEADWSAANRLRLAREFLGVTAAHVILPACVAAKYATVTHHISPETFSGLGRSRRQLIETLRHGDPTSLAAYADACPKPLSSAVAETLDELGLPISRASDGRLLPHSNLLLLTTVGVMSYPWMDPVLFSKSVEAYLAQHPHMAIVHNPQPAGIVCQTPEGNVE